MNKSVLAVNISWNPYQWRRPYTNPHAGHSYVHDHPGHESLNFKFDKKIDTNGFIHGYVQWQYVPKKFVKGGMVLFYTKNIETRESHIVGVYGDVEILDPVISVRHEKFENNSLIINLKAKKSLSLLFPLPLDSKNYIKGRMVGQVGFTYYDERLALKIITDEYNHLSRVGNILQDEIVKLNNIHKYICGKDLAGSRIPLKSYADKDNDEVEQDAIEKYISKQSREEMINELKNLKPGDPEKVQIRSNSFKRDNKTIAQIKILRGYKCQICSKSIKKKNGGKYIEAAHVVPKHKQGNELPKNIIILCPNHHKEFDLGNRIIIEHDEKKLKFIMNGKKYVIDLTFRI